LIRFVDSLLPARPMVARVFPTALLLFLIAATARAERLPSRVVAFLKLLN